VDGAERWEDVGFVARCAEGNELGFEGGRGRMRMGDSRGGATRHGVSARCIVFRALIGCPTSQRFDLAAITRAAPWIFSKRTTRLL
jgi:hypothetical protein